MNWSSKKRLGTKSLNRIRLGSLLVCSILSTQCVAHARPAPSEHPLAELNQHARTIYAQARNELLDSGDPVLVVFSGDKIVLLHDGKQKSYPYVNAHVNGLKTVAHTALAAWTLLERSTHAPAAWQALAQAFARDMKASEPMLAAYRFSQEETARQLAIMRAVEAALQRTEPPDARAVAAFAAAMSPRVMANVDTAARLLLEGLNTQTQQIKTDLGAQKFAAMRVVVLGGHMARQGELAGQYFQRLFGGEAEGQRWIYAENTRDEAGALDTLGVHLIDNAASNAFYGNPARLHRDVLSDAAQQHLDSMTLPTL